MVLAPMLLALQVGLGRAANSQYDYPDYVYVDTYAMPDCTGGVVDRRVHQMGLCALNKDTGYKEKWSCQGAHEPIILRTYPNDLSECTSNSLNTETFPDHDAGFCVDGQTMTCALNRSDTVPTDVQQTPKIVERRMYNSVTCEPDKLSVAYHHVSGRTGTECVQFEGSTVLQEWQCNPDRFHVKLLDCDSAMTERAEYFNGDVCVVVSRDPEWAYRFNAGNVCPTTVQEIVGCAMPGGTLPATACPGLGQDTRLFATRARGCMFGDWQSVCDDEQCCAGLNEQCTSWLKQVTCHTHCSVCPGRPPNPDVRETREFGWTNPAGICADECPRLTEYAKAASCPTCVGTLLNDMLCYGEATATWPDSPCIREVPVPTTLQDEFDGADGPGTGDGSTTGGDSGDGTSTASSDGSDVASTIADLPVPAIVGIAAGAVCLCAACIACIVCTLCAAKTSSTTTV